MYWLIKTEKKDVKVRASREDMTCDDVAFAFQMKFDRSDVGAILEIIPLGLEGGMS